MLSFAAVTEDKSISDNVGPDDKISPALSSKVLDEYGSGYASDVILAFEWAVNNSARIINFSSGISFSSGGSNHYPTFTIVIDKVVAAPYVSGTVALCWEKTCTQAV